MRLIKQGNIEYFGLKIDVPAGTKYVATDCNGNVWAYSHRPLPNNLGEWYKTAGSQEFVVLVDLEGMDWRQTRIEL